MKREWMIVGKSGKKFFGCVLPIFIFLHVVSEYSLRYISLIDDY